MNVAGIYYFGLAATKSSVTLLMIEEIKTLRTYLEIVRERLHSDWGLRKQEPTLDLKPLVHLQTCV